MRRIITGIATALLAVGLLVAPGLTPKAAAAKQISNAKVGTIRGYYLPKPYRDYGGTFRPSPLPVEGVHCVIVQRKSGGGVWTHNYVTGPENCNPAAETVWTITDDAKVADTVAIRLYVTESEIYDGSFVVLCTSKAACLAM